MSFFEILKNYVKTTNQDIFFNNCRYRTLNHRYIISENFGKEDLEDGEKKEDGIDDIDDMDYIDYVADMESIHPLLNWILPFVPKSIQEGEDHIFRFCVKGRIVFQGDDSIFHVFLTSKHKDPEYYYRIHLRVYMGYVMGEKKGKKTFKIIKKDIVFDKFSFLFMDKTPPFFEYMLKKQIETMISDDLKVFASQIKAFIRSHGFDSHSNPTRLPNHLTSPVSTPRAH
jgi:hypothetical protein